MKDTEKALKKELSRDFIGHGQRLLILRGGHIRSIRLQKEKKLLLNSQLKVTKIAYETLYTSLVYFSRRFSKRYEFFPNNSKFSMKILRKDLDIFSRSVAARKRS